MTRKRMIDPGIWQSEQVGTLPPEGRLLFIGMFSNADDEGRLKASPAYLKAIIFPYDENLTLKRVEELKQQIASHGLVVLYRSAAQEYLWLPTWDRYQKIKTPSPSQLPPPPAGSPIPLTPSTRSEEEPPAQRPTTGMETPPSDVQDDGRLLRQDIAAGGETLPKDFRNDGETLEKRFSGTGDGQELDKPLANGAEIAAAGSPNNGETYNKDGEGVLQQPSNGGETFRKDFRNDGETLPKHFGNVSETFPPRLEEVRGSKERLGEYRLVEGKGSGETVPGPGQPPADGLQPPASSTSNRETGESLPDASPGERQCLKLLRGVPHWPFDFPRDLAYLRQLAVGFPRVDMLREIGDFATHAMDKPIKNRGSPRLRLRHWIEKGAQFAEERRRQGERGRETGQGLSQPGRPPEKAHRKPIQPIESGPDDGVASPGKRLVRTVEPDDTS